MKEQNKEMAETNPKSVESLKVMFNSKYEEFANDLLKALPELTAQIQACLQLHPEERFSRFVGDILPSHGPVHDESKCPGQVLPGVTVTEELWNELGDSSHTAIYKYLNILSFCSIYESSKLPEAMGGEKMKEWTATFLNQWKEKLSSIDFESMSKKLSELLGSMGPTAFPKLPEKLLKGHLAKLAEELVREFKPEDFGLSEDELRECDKNPSKAFELLTDIYTKKPDLLQNAIKRISNRLQEKIKRGELRPEQIAAEAEELMKEFTENNAFTELMQSFKGVFGMEDPDIARQVGRPEDARRSIVRDRLRKKLEAKRNGNK